VEPACSSLVDLNSGYATTSLCAATRSSSYLILLWSLLNDRRFMRSRRAERNGKSPRELMTGQGHPHWLTLLGLGPRSRPANLNPGRLGRLRSGQPLGNNSRALTLSAIEFNVKRRIPLSSSSNAHTQAASRRSFCPRSGVPEDATQSRRRFLAACLSALPVVAASAKTYHRKRRPT
jgi:hypothetical protein